MKGMKLHAMAGLLLLVTGVQAQVIRIDAKITDVDGKVVRLEAVSSSASSGCASSDFPVMRAGERVQVMLEDYKYITVMPYEPSSNEALYVTAELEDPNGGTEKVEISKHLRFSGRSGGERKSLVLMNISMIEVFRVEE